MTSEAVKPETCSLCRQPRLVTRLRDAGQPLLQNQLYPTAELARTAATGELHLVQCVACGFVANRAAAGTSLAFSEGYNSDQTTSPRFSAHADAVLDRVTRRLSAGEYLGRAVGLCEVGCGQGYFLKRLRSRFDADTLHLIGFDTAASARVEPGLVVHSRHFDGTCASLVVPRVDSVVSRFALEYVDDPIAFFVAIGQVLAPGGRVYIETRDADWSWRNQAVEDVSCELRSYFTASTLELGMRKAGFGEVHCERAFDEQFLWVEAAEFRPDGGTDTPGISATADTVVRAVASLEAFFSNWSQSLADLSTSLSTFKAQGGVALWGAGTKGIGLSSLLASSGCRVDGLIDIDPYRQGRFTPRDAVPVYAPAVAAECGIRTVVAANEAYLEEIRQRVAADGLPLRVLGLADCRY